MWISQLLLIKGLRRLRQDGEDFLGIVHVEFVCIEGFALWFQLCRCAAEEIGMSSHYVAFIAVFQPRKEDIVPLVEAPHNWFDSRIEILDRVALCGRVVVFFDQRECVWQLIFLIVGDPFSYFLAAVVAAVFIGLVPQSRTAMFRDEDLAFSDFINDGYCQDSSAVFYE